jgi:hypothetical protein
MAFEMLKPVMEDEPYKAFLETKKAFPDFNGGGILRLSRYVSRPTAALGWFSADGEQMSILSVNLEDYGFIPPNGYTFIKSWGENTGMYEILLGSGAVNPTGIMVPAGFCTSQLVEINFDKFTTN